MKQNSTPCPCGSSKSYAECCARFIEAGEAAPSAEALMRSRYTAYTLLKEDYLLASWHPSSRPAALGLTDEAPTKWIGLEVKRHQQQDATHATVEFVARYKVNGRAHRLHEASRFEQEAGRWFYVDGDIQDGHSATARR
jgi:SEC-C motif-containing protein